MDTNEASYEHDVSHPSIMLTILKHDESDEQQNIPFTSNEVQSNFNTPTEIITSQNNVQSNIQTTYTHPTNGDDINESDSQEPSPLNNEEKYQRLHQDDHEIEENYERTNTKIFNTLPKSSKSSRKISRKIARADEPQTGNTCYAKLKGCLKHCFKTKTSMVLSLITRSAAMFDMVTDIILTYQSSRANFLYLTVFLFLSIIAPYLLQYSCGIKLFTQRRTFEKFSGFTSILVILYLLPTGVLYFMFLDLFDILFTYYSSFRMFCLCCYNKSMEEIKTNEAEIAHQLLMDRTIWEGLKRQKAVSQLMFETFPQVAIQTLLYNGIISGQDAAKISPTSLLLSIGSAIFSAFVQMGILRYEAVAVKESFWQYSLTCFMARIEWIPFRNTIRKVLEKEPVYDVNCCGCKRTLLKVSKTEEITCCWCKTLQGKIITLTSQRVEKPNCCCTCCAYIYSSNRKCGGCIKKKEKDPEKDNEYDIYELKKCCGCTRIRKHTTQRKDESDLRVIDYNINYKIPLTKCINNGIDQEVGFDFSENTIKELMATLMLRKRRKRIDDDNETPDWSRDGSNRIEIRFHQSLKLLSVVQLVDLLRICSKRLIIIRGLNNPQYLKWGRALNISRELGQDLGQLKYSKDSTGKPHLMSIYESEYRLKKFAKMIYLKKMKRNESEMIKKSSPIKTNTRIKKKIRIFQDNGDEASVTIGFHEYDDPEEIATKYVNKQKWGETIEDQKKKRSYMYQIASQVITNEITQQSTREEKIEFVLKKLRILFKLKRNKIDYEQKIESDLVTDVFGDINNPYTIKWKVLLSDIEINEWFEKTDKQKNGSKLLRCFCCCTCCNAKQNNNNNNTTEQYAMNSKELLVIIKY
eukprot:201351_1